MARRSSFRRHVLLTAVALGPLCVLGGPAQAADLIVDDSSHDAVGSEAYSSGTVGYTGAGALNIAGAGNEVIFGGTSNPGLSVGRFAGSKGVVNVSDSGLLKHTATGPEFVIGDRGAGEMNITNGGIVSNPWKVTLGNNEGSSGKVYVAGPGSLLHAGVYLNVANGGDSTLEVTDEGFAHSDGNIIVGAKSSKGIVTVSNGATISAAGVFAVGDSGDGVVNVQAGSTASDGVAGWDGGLVVARLAGSTGEVNVTGPEAKWLTRGLDATSIGVSGTGRMTISDGGLVDVQAAATSTVGLNESGDGTVIVTGQDSVLRTAGELTVGDAGIGHVIVSEGGTVVAEGITLGRSATGSGTLTIGSVVGDAPVGVGFVDAPWIKFGDGTGRVEFNHSDVSGAYEFATAISGDGSVNVYSGTTVLTAKNTYTGGTTIEGGTLQLGNGRANGDGSITGDVTNNGVLAFKAWGGQTLDGVISGTGAVHVIGAGTVTLTGTNTYAGGTLIDRSTLQISSDANLGDVSGALTINGGMLELNANVAMARNITLGADGALIETYEYDLDHSGVISGDGALNKGGAGTLTLSGANVYTGETTLYKGNLRAGAENSLSASSSITLGSGTQLDLAGHDQTIAGLTNAGIVTLGADDTQPGTVLTIDGDYVGQRGLSGQYGTIVFNTVLGDDNSATDRMHVKGDTSGESNVKVNNVGGVGDYTADGIKLIEVDGISDGNFVLLGDYDIDGRQFVVGGGAFAYTLEQNGLNDENGDWYLRSELDPNPGGGDNGVGNPGGGDTGGGDNGVGNPGGGDTGGGDNGGGNPGGGDTGGGDNGGGNPGGGDTGGGDNGVGNPGGGDTGGGDNGVGNPGGGDTGGGDNGVGNPGGGDTGGGDNGVGNPGGGDTGGGDNGVGNPGGGDTGGGDNGVGNPGGGDTGGGDNGVGNPGGGDTGGGDNGVGNPGGGDTGGGDNGGGETGGGDKVPETGEKHPEGQKPGPKFYQAGAPVYEQYPQALQALNDLPTLRQRVGQHAWSADDGEAVRGSRVWGRVVGEFGQSEPATSTTGAHRSQEQAQLQMGADFALSESDAGTLVGGINGRYGTSSTDVSSRFGNGKIETDVVGVGATLTWYGENGLYADAQAQYSRYQSDLTSSTAKRTLAKDNDGHGVAASVETGWKQELSDGWSLTPQAQLTYSQVGIEAFEDAFGADVSLTKGESLRGRLSVALDRETSSTGKGGKRSSSHLYAQPNLHYEFLDGSEVKLGGKTATNSASLATRDDRLWGGLSIGGTNSWNDGKVQVFGEVNADTSLKNPGDSYSVGGRVGVKFKW